MYIYEKLFNMSDFFFNNSDAKKQNVQSQKRVTNQNGSGKILRIFKDSIKDKSICRIDSWKIHVRKGGERKK